MSEQKVSNVDLMRGDLIGADFDYFPDDPDDDRIVVMIAVPGHHLIGSGRCVIQDEPTFDARLPTYEDVRGILAAPAGLPSEDQETRQ